MMIEERAGDDLVIGFSVPDIWLYFLVEIIKLDFSYSYFSEYIYAYDFSFIR